MHRLSVVLAIIFLIVTTAAGDNPFQWFSRISLSSKNPNVGSLAQVRQILVEKDVSDKSNEMTTYIGGIIKATDYVFESNGSTTDKLVVPYYPQPKAGEVAVSRSFVASFKFKSNIKEDTISPLKPVWAISSQQNYGTETLVSQPLAHLAVPPTYSGSDASYVYVTGLFENSISFGATTGNMSTSVLGYYIGKLNAKGEALWLRALPAVNKTRFPFWNELPWPIACQFETLNHVAVVGSFLGKIELKDVDDTNVVLKSPENTVSPFLIMFDKTTGVVLHASQGFGVTANTSNWSINLGVDVEWDEPTSKLYVALLQFTADLNTTSGRFANKSSSHATVVSVEVKPKKSNVSKKPNDAGGYSVTYEMLLTSELGKLPLVHDSWRRGELLGLLVLRRSFNDNQCSIVLYGHFTVSKLHLGELSVDLDSENKVVGAFVAGFTLDSGLKATWAHYLPTATALDSDILGQSIRISAGPLADGDVMQSFVAVYGYLPSERLKSLVKPSSLLGNIKEYDSNTYLVCLDSNGAVLAFGSIPAVDPSDFEDVTLKPVSIAPSVGRGLFLLYAKTGTSTLAKHTMGVLAFGFDSSGVTTVSPAIPTPTGTVLVGAPTSDADFDDDSNLDNASDEGWLSGSGSFNPGFAFLALLGFAGIVVGVFILHKRNAVSSIFGGATAVPLDEFQLGSGRRDRGGFVPLTEDPQHFEGSMANVDDEYLRASTESRRGNTILFDALSDSANRNGTNVSSGATWDSFQDNSKTVQFSKDKQPLQESKNSEDDDWNWK